MMPHPWNATWNYEVENLSNHVSGSKAFCTIAHSAGVVATLGRAAAFTPNSPSSWTWTVGWDGVEFRGNGIVFQQRNWTSMILGRSSWFNGCKFTNSIGTRDSTYWNNGNGPGYVGTGSLMCWMDNVYTEYVSGVFLNNFYAINCQAKMLGGSVFTGNYYLYNNYVRNFDNSYFRNTTPGIKITYTNTGGHTAARIIRTGSSAYAPGQSIVLQVDGATAATIPLGFYSTDTNPTTTDVANAINAVGNGWSATILNSRGGWFGASIGFNGADWNFNIDVFTTPASLANTPDPHGEWFQAFGSPLFQNAIWRDNVQRDNPSEININNAPSTDKQQDWIVKGNVFLGVGSISQFGTGPNNGGGASHYVFENNTIQSQILRVDSQGTGDFVYSSYKNNIVGGAFTDTNPNFLATPPWINNFYIQVTSGAMNVSSNIGNVSYTNFSSLFM